MRPVNDAGKFTVASEVKGSKVKVFVTALDKDDEFLNFLDMGGSVIGPDVELRELKLAQTAPGRYVGEFDAQDAGSYFMMVSPGAGMAPIRTGVNVPYSAEFSDREADVGLLTSLADLAPRGGGTGRMIDGTLDSGGMDELLAVNSFRRDLPAATSSQDAWHLLVLSAACLFFFDVFFRRVTVGWAWARDARGPAARSIAAAARCCSGDRIHGSAAQPQGRGDGEARAAPLGGQIRTDA